MGQWMLHNHTLVSSIKCVCAFACMYLCVCVRESVIPSVFIIKNIYKMTITISRLWPSIELDVERICTYLVSYSMYCNIYCKMRYAKWTFHACNPLHVSLESCEPKNSRCRADSSLAQFHLRCTRTKISTTRCIQSIYFTIQLFPRI